MGAISIAYPILYTVTAAAGVLSNALELDDAVFKTCGPYGIKQIKIKIIKKRYVRKGR